MHISQQLAYRKNRRQLARTGVIADRMQYQIVAVDHFIAPTVAQQPFDFTAFIAADPARIRIRISRKPAPDQRL
jgi:hypothetical protein